jgi:hypothetical protein
MGTYSDNVVHALTRLSCPRGLRPRVHFRREKACIASHRPANQHEVVQSRSHQASQLLCQVVGRPLAGGRIQLFVVHTLVRPSALSLSRMSISQPVSCPVSGIVSKLARQPERPLPHYSGSAHRHWFQCSFGPCRSRASVKSAGGPSAGTCALPSFCPCSSEACLHIRVFVRRSVSQPVCQFVTLSGCSSVCLSDCPFVCLTAGPSMSSSGYP